MKPKNPDQGIEEERERDLPDTTNDAFVKKEPKLVEIAKSQTLGYNSVRGDQIKPATDSMLERKEKTRVPSSGGWCCILSILLFLAMAGSIVGGAIGHPAVFGATGLLLIVMACVCCGLFTVGPNEARVLTMFGEYKGTVKENGLFWINPFYHKVPMSLAFMNTQSSVITVNDKVGNPVEIGVVLVW